MKSAFYSFSSMQTANFIAVMLLLFSAAPARADSSIVSSPRVLQEALSTSDRVTIYNTKTGSGLNLSGGLFSGRASGIDPAVNNYLNDSMDRAEYVDRTAEMEGDQRVYALLVDGSYDFNYDLGSGLPLHPYMTAGAGMAMYDHTNAPSASTLALQDGGTVPLFRLGGGVTYRLGQQWNLALDYKAGLSGGSDQVLLGHGSPQQTDLQVLNMGMHYQF
jgi:hypothetical protein